MQTVRNYSLFLFAFFVSGCAGLMTEAFHTSPDVTIKSGLQKSPSQPIMLSVVDDEGNKREDDFGLNLIDAISKAYPKSSKIVPEVYGPVQGSVSIQIRVRRLGAFFNRTKYSVLERSGYKTFVSGDSATWKHVVDSAKGEQPVVSGFVGGPKATGVIVGWSGIVIIDVDVYDFRIGKPQTFTVSIAAERSSLNTFGLLTAKLNAAEAWDIVAPRLVNFLEASVVKIEAEEITS